MVMSLITSKNPENIEYHGRYGITQYCLDAIIRLMQCSVWINKASLLTYDKTHCFLLTIDEDHYVAIKAGFASGYNGEGSRGLATALSLFERHRIETQEYEVPRALMRRLNDGSLTRADLGFLKNASAIRPIRLFDYIYPFKGIHGFSHKELNVKFPTVVPFRVVDPRIMDMALKLESDADSALITAYRRLEQIVLLRCTLTGFFGSELFKKAFSGKDSCLYWPGLDGSEGAGRASLFIAAYMAFRNKRAHKELKISPQDSLREFLILNELYLLEAEAIERPTQ
jgi:hypothetical protein